MKILLIEDEFYIRKVIKTKFASAGYTVLTAENGEEGLKIAREERPSLIITDLLMPKIDGFMVCRLLKEIKETANIPIIILTALGQKDDIEKAKSAGADKVILKPFSPRELLKEVEQMLRVVAS